MTAKKKKPIIALAVVSALLTAGIISLNRREKYIPTPIAITSNIPTPRNTFGIVTRPGFEFSLSAIAIIDCTAALEL